jgi:hypothetical protein
VVKRILDETDKQSAESNRREALGGKQSVPARLRDENRKRITGNRHASG